MGSVARIRWTRRCGGLNSNSYLLLFGCMFVNVRQCVVVRRISPRSSVDSCYVCLVTVLLDANSPGYLCFYTNYNMWWSVLWSVYHQITVSGIRDGILHVGIVFRAVDRLTFCCESSTKRYHEHSFKGHVLSVQCSNFRQGMCLTSVWRNADIKGVPTSDDEYASAFSYETSSRRGQHSCETSYSLLIDFVWCSWPLLNGYDVWCCRSVGLHILGTCISGGLPPCGKFWLSDGNLML